MTMYSIIGGIMKSLVDNAFMVMVRDPEFDYNHSPNKENIALCVKDNNCLFLTYMEAAAVAKDLHEQFGNDYCVVKISVKAFYPEHQTRKYDVDEYNV